MGREIRRAHKDFDWPLKKTWWGYLLDPIPCQHCDGSERAPNGKCCPTCEGEGEVYPKVNPNTYDLDSVPRWLDMEFNKGEYGWQMWETTSEGSPISPVCESPEVLAKWLTDNNASTFADMTATYDQWLTMIKGSGCAMSAIFSREKGLESGVVGLGGT